MSPDPGTSAVVTSGDSESCRRTTRRAGEVVVPSSAPADAGRVTRATRSRAEIRWGSAGALVTLAPVNRRRQKKLTRRLVAAVLCDDGRAVDALLRAGADPGAADADGVTPLYTACVQGGADTARRLLRAGAPPDAESGGTGADGTPLCAAACWGHTETVRTLLAHGADPALREDEGTGRTPLEWAREGGHAETVAVLVAAGAG